MRSALNAVAFGLTLASVILHGRPSSNLLFMVALICFVIARVGK